VINKPFLKGWFLKHFFKAFLTNAAQCYSVKFLKMNLKS